MITACRPKRGARWPAQHLRNANKIVWESSWWLSLKKEKRDREIGVAMVEETGAAANVRAKKALAALKALVIPDLAARVLIRLKERALRIEKGERMRADEVPYNSVDENDSDDEAVAPGAVAAVKHRTVALEVARLRHEDYIVALLGRLRSVEPTLADALDRARPIAGRPPWHSHDDLAKQAGIPIRTLDRKIKQATERLRAMKPRQK